MENIHLILQYTVCYGIFLTLACLAKTNNGYRLISEKNEILNKNALLGLQFSGILWLGILPIHLFEQPAEAVIFGSSSPSYWLLILIILLVIVAAFLSNLHAGKTLRKLAERKTQPDPFNKSFITQYFILRTGYLISNEMFFRGYLLTDCIQHVGILSAILINTGLYSLAHLPGGRKEMVTCIPIGVALCSVSILFQAAWPAIVLHLVMSHVFEIGLAKKISQTLKPVL